MKKIYIIANWKSNKTIKETKAWLTQISNLNPFDKLRVNAKRSRSIKSQISNIEGKEIIICPSFTLLSEVESGIRNHGLRIKIGAQNISSFDEGPYTGEVSAKQVKELAEFVLIGHSERRDNFTESDEIVNKKIEQAFKYSLIPIVCISSIEQVKNLKQKITNNRILVAYEPLFAIGSGNPDTPENADKMCQSIKTILGEIPTLYGGSVDKKNIKSFTKMLSIDGALVGKASLAPLEFLEIIKNA